MQARRVGPASWEANAPAKLNLFLEILGRRADGFHELETLMAPVRLFDRVVWSAAPPGDGLDFRCRRASLCRVDRRANVPLNASNLAVRAADLLGRHAGVQPYGKLELWKRIPPQAGLGGGSSDAAATLVVLNQAWNLNLPMSRLSELAARLGSDVPFFLFGGFAIARGRGELLEAVTGTPRLHTVVVKPAGGVSTSAAFEKLRAGDAPPAEPSLSSRRIAELVSRLRAGGIGRLSRLLRNRLQSAACALNPLIQRLEHAFREAACPAHAMTGSGSAYFGIVPTARCARQLAKTISAMQLGAVYVLSSCR